MVGLQNNMKLLKIAVWRKSRLEDLVFQEVAPDVDLMQDTRGDRREGGKRALLRQVKAVRQSRANWGSWSYHSYCSIVAVSQRMIG